MTIQCLRSTSFGWTPTERHFVALFRCLDATIRSVVPTEKFLTMTLYGPTPEERAIMRQMAVVALEMSDEGYEPADIAQYLKRNYLSPDW